MKRYPKGFDIDIEEVINEYDVDLRKFEIIHDKKNGFACFLGKTNSYYRRSQIDKIFTKRIKDGEQTAI